MTARLFPALLKYWRGRHGLSQLDLALAAGLSSRHLSFLETGRAQPSEEMVLRLADTLGLSLRDQNEVLRAAGFAARFAEPGLEALPPEADWAIARMLAQQEPYPLAVLSAGHDIVRINGAGRRMLQAFVADPARLPDQPNMFDLVFDPALARPFIANWAELGRHMLSRLQREALQSSGGTAPARLLERALSQPGVPDDWRRPDFGLALGSTLTLRLRRGGTALNFLTTITTFSSPQLVTLQELRIESYFPLDDTTRSACERLPGPHP
jgi:transcriptional regulator with XRE-family HTH domain